MSSWTGLVAICAALLLRLAQANPDFSSLVLVCDSEDEGNCTYAASFTTTVSTWNSTTTIVMGSAPGQALPDRNRQHPQKLLTAACTTTITLRCRGAPA